MSAQEGSAVSTVQACLMFTWEMLVEEGGV